MNLKKSKLMKMRQVVFLVLSSIIPKKRGLIIFYPTHNKKGFSGNLKSLFIYMHNNKSKINYHILWCTNNKRIYEKLKSNNYPVVLNKFIVKYYLFRAQHIIQDSTHMSLVGNFSIVQLWHGTGFKNIGLLDDTNTFQKIHLLKEAYSCYKLIAASSQEDADRKRKSFDNPNIFITGSPKNDVFFQDTDLNNNLKDKYNLGKFNKIYAYTPTFRDQGEFDPFSIKFWKDLNNWLVENNNVFIVKKHPWDHKLIIPEYPNILDLTDTVSDVQELLLFSDVLISDYSAIVTDFAITGKPIIFYFYDYINYTSIRNFYYDLKEVLPGPFIYDSETLLSTIKELSWFEDPDYQAKNAKFRFTFHKYMDGNSSERVLEEIKKLD